MYATGGGAHWCPRAHQNGDVDLVTQVADTFPTTRGTGVGLNSFVIETVVGAEVPERS